MDDTSLGIDLNVTPLYKKDETPQMNDKMVGGLNQMSLDNKKLREMILVVLDKHKSLQNHVNKLMQEHDLSVSNPNKRKFGDQCDDCNTSGSSKSIISNPNMYGVKKVYRQTDPSDKSMIVKDGYQWRKYGQKVTRDNPYSPRAYYKCSFAPSCPVKKKVQRSVDNESLLVAIYDGEHNHESAQNEHEILDQTVSNNGSNSPMKFDAIFVEQMANSLRRNPDFIEELAVAISAKIMEND